MEKRMEQQADQGSLAMAEGAKAEGRDARVGEDPMEDERLAPTTGKLPMEILGPATGTQDRELATGLALDVFRGLDIMKSRPLEDENEDDDWDDEERRIIQRRRELAAKDERFHTLATLAAMRAIGPRDGLEGMLAAQMVCAHGVAVDFTRQAMRDGQYMENRTAYMRQAGKLMTLFARQIETLDRRRGQWAASVGRVNVEAGGQAIVGTVHSEAVKSE
jgi:hypothetical protein